MPDATDNRVLSQLMLLQGTLDSMPTDESMSRFVVRGLKSVPGVRSLNVCIRGAVAEKNDLCASCNYRWGEADDNFDNHCKLGGYDSTKCLPIRTVDRLYGLIVFSLNDTPDAFTPYEPYLQNIVNVIAISIDNRHQRQALEALNKQLRGEVEYRKRVEDTLRKSEEGLKYLSNQLEAILDHIPGLVFYKDKKNNFIRVNKYLAQAQTKNKQELEGKNLSELYPKEDAEKYYQDDLAVINSGVARLNIEEPWETSDGVKWVSTSKIPFLDDDGEIIGVIGMSMDITDRKIAEEKIKASLREKETMLKEIHHRVKNNLQVISSLLDLQSSYVQDEKAKEALRESMERVRTMATIHTQLYQSQDLTKVDFGLFIRDLISNISQSYGRSVSPVEINVNAEETRLDIDASIPCGLILNELVSNALKHAFPGGKEGKINITMRSEDNQIVLTVSDNGIGLPKSIDFNNLKSLGLQLVNILVGQMNGKIDLQVDVGTTWTIIFPINNERERQNG